MHGAKTLAACEEEKCTRLLLVKHAFNKPLSLSRPVSDPGPSSATCRNVEGCGIDSELPPNVDASDLSALSPLGVDASSSSSDVPVPVPAVAVAVMI